VWWNNEKGDAFMTHDHHGHTRAHDHSEDGHSHGAGHVHAPATFGKAFAIGVALNAGFVMIEVAYGILGNSVALLADAGHNLGDVLGLLVAWTASVLVKRAPSARFTYGLRGSSWGAARLSETSGCGKLNRNRRYRDDGR
jgi:cobalt-zinc-cadmium efflux system protein